MTTLKDAFNVERVGTCQYKTFIPAASCSHGFAHGGLLVSLIQLAVEQAFELDFTRAHQPDLLDLHSSMLRRTLAGEVTINITEAKLGPTISTVSFNLLQNSKVNITGFATHTNFIAPHPTLLDFPYTNPSILHPEPPSRPNFSLLESNADPDWTRVSYHPHPVLPIFAMPQLSCYYFTPSFSPTSTPKPSLGPRATEFWISPLSTDFTFCTSHLGFVADMMLRLGESVRPGNETAHFTIQSVIDRGIKQRQGRSAEIPPLHDTTVTHPTLGLSLEVKKPLPKEGVRWLYIRGTMQWYEGGKYDTEIVICDRDMNLVALSRFMSLAVDLDMVAKLAKEKTTVRAGDGLKVRRGNTEKL